MTICPVEYGQMKDLVIKGQGKAQNAEAKRLKAKEHGGSSWRKAKGIGQRAERRANITERMEHRL